jgi:hypothetical protein
MHCMSRRATSAGPYLDGGLGDRGGAGGAEHVGAERGECVPEAAPRGAPLDRGLHSFELDLKLNATNSRTRS